LAPAEEETHGYSKFSADRYDNPDEGPCGVWKGISDSREEEEEEEEDMVTNYSFHTVPYA